MAHNPFMGLPVGLLEELAKTLGGWIPAAGNVRAMVADAIREDQRTAILGALRQELREATKRAVDSIMRVGGLSYNEASEVVRDAVKDHVTELSNQIFARTFW